MNHNSIVTRHEVGHFVALCASGLYDEFTSITNQAANGAFGLTERNGQSLTDYSQKLVADLTNYLSVMRNVGRDVVLKNLCYFFGGGSIDRLYGCDSAIRNSIDDTNNKTLCLPAIGISGVSDERYAELQAMVDEFLHPIFRAEAPFIARLCDELARRGTISKADMDAIVQEAGWAPSQHPSFDALLARFHAWCDQ